MKVLMVVVLLGIPLFTALTLASHTTQEIISLTASQGILFVGLSFFEALGFEIGIISIFLVLPVIKKMDKDLARHFKTMYYPLLWMLMSWWPHDYAHLHNNMGIWGLLFIEYGFHLTSIIAAAIVIYGLSNLIQDYLTKKALT